MYRVRKDAKLYNPSKTAKNLRSGKIACPFCDIHTPQIKAKGKRLLVIENIYRYRYWEFMDVIEHLMIVPKRHVESLHELTKAEHTELMSLMSDYQALAYNVYIREKTNVIKSVPHLHIHLIKTRNRRAKFFLYLKKPYLVWKR